MRIFKRNAVIITVLLFVCAAVYLNWQYGQNGEDTDKASGDTSETDVTVTDDAGSDSEDASLYYEGEEGDTSLTDSMTEYFDSVRLSRQQARDDATETLQLVTTTENASQEVIDNALAEITRIAQWSVLESEIESLIIAKGFDDCVVYMSEDGVTVTVPVPEEGMSTATVARITDIITDKTDFAADKLNIVEIN